MPKMILKQLIHTVLHMLFENIIYISEGYFGKKTANSIQVECMCNSFIENGLNVELISRGKKANVKHKLSHKNFSGSLNLYRIRVLFYMLYNFYRKKTFIYGRSFLIQHILSMFGVKSILELHTDELNSNFKILLFKISNSKNIKYVGISSVIFEDDIWNEREKIILHDGHNNYSKINFTKKNEKLKIGYFGKIAERKGLSVLEYLDLNKPDNIQLNIYSSDSRYKFFFKNVNEFKWLERNEIYKKMKEMDVLLLPIKKVLDSDYSRFTSPLKLFEYASCGRGILYSPVDSLLELNFPIGFYACNTNEDWINKIQYIFNKHIYLDESIQLDIYNWSKDYTWDSRVKTILKYAHS
jgi:hypothetical protein